MAVGSGEFTEGRGMNLRAPGAVAEIMDTPTVHVERVEALNLDTAAIPFGSVLPQLRRRSAGSATSR